ncbi:hypothetical protein TW80_07155 [Loktanella sp. S4079]|nr:hypothetical protein TW80_07155 [Loktanella sp. S4079]
MIVSEQHTVCLVGGARVNPATITLILPHVEKFIAVDGGADHLLTHEKTPIAVIGDLDSISEHARATFAEQLVHIAEQDTTDFEKALSRVDAPVVIAAGFTGGRIDHTLATLNVLARFSERRVVLVDDCDASFVISGRFCEIDAPVGARIAIMPLAETMVSVTGVRWPFQDRLMRPDGFIGSSNQVTGPVSVRSDGPVLVSLASVHLDVALRAVSRG